MRRKILTWCFTTMALGMAQQQSRTPSASLNPCPGGTGSAEIDPVSTPSTLDQLVRSSQLIVVGTVSSVLPAFVTNPEHLNSIETDSLVSVRQVLDGTLPFGTTTITLGQTGGKAGPCGLVVPADPLVVSGEEYLLFLRTDTRAQPLNGSGFTRYYTVGVWSGKVKVVNGKIQFRPSATAPLHKYDGINLNDFLALLTPIVEIVHPKK